MSSTDFTPGLAGVVAFETEIAEPDKEGGELRYRGVNIEDLVGSVPFEKVWGLLVDESLEPGLPYEHVDLESRTGGYISDLQSSLARLSGEPPMHTASGARFFAAAVRRQCTAIHHSFPRIYPHRWTLLHIPQPIGG